MFHTRSSFLETFVLKVCHLMSGESDERRMFSELSGIAFDNRHWQQATVDIDNSGVQKDGEF